MPDYEASFDKNYTAYDTDHYYKYIDTSFIEIGSVVPRRYGGIQKHCQNHVPLGFTVFG